MPELQIITADARKILEHKNFLATLNLKYLQEKTLIIF